MELGACTRKGADGHSGIEVHDHCGGLTRGAVERMFVPFSQRNDDRSGLGLPIARQNVEREGGNLTARNEPGIGCTSTICLPLNNQRAGLPAWPAAPT